MEDGWDEGGMGGGTEAASLDEERMDALEAGVVENGNDVCPEAE